MAQVVEEKERLQKEKGDELAALSTKLHSMEKSYEAILQVGGDVSPAHVLYVVFVCACVYKNCSS